MAFPGRTTRARHGAAGAPPTQNRGGAASAAPRRPARMAAPGAGGQGGPPGPGAGGPGGPGQPTWLRRLVGKDSAPRVRIRTPRDKRFAQLAELAVVNERLAGGDPIECRRRLEYLQKNRENWEQVYEIVTEQQAMATLENIEAANRKVEEALSDANREGQSAGSLQSELELLQEELSAARGELQLTENRVRYTTQALEELQREAERLELCAEDEGCGTAEGDDFLPAAGATGFPLLPDLDLDVGGSAPQGLPFTGMPRKGLKAHWYPVEFADRLGPGDLCPVDLFGDSWVLWRDETGLARCVLDSCAHRACPLSLGSVQEGRVACAYHGWQFDGEGQCQKIPSARFRKGISVKHLPTAEVDGMIFVWPCQDSVPQALPEQGKWSPPAGYEVLAELEIDLPLEHGLLLENLLDLAHAPFSNGGWCLEAGTLPRFLQFRTLQALEGLTLPGMIHPGKSAGGAWDSYPVDLTFEPPCMVVSTIGLEKPGSLERGANVADCANHLHQVHVCLPSRPGRTRLLYRMSVDFVPFLWCVPGLQSVWESTLREVLGEGLALVVGQQDRLKQAPQSDGAWRGAGGDQRARERATASYSSWRKEMGP